MLVAKVMDWEGAKLEQCSLNSAMSGLLILELLGIIPEITKVTVTMTRTVS